MTKTMIVQYRTAEDRTDENAELVRAVYAQLADEHPTGVAYTALRLDDGVSYVHIVELDAEQNPIPDLDSFARFQAGIADRCVDGPTPSGATVVGSYRG
jgi:hypothetical protein